MTPFSLQLTEKWMKSVLFIATSENYRRFAPHPINTPGTLILEWRTAFNNQTKGITKRNYQAYAQNIVSSKHECKKKKKACSHLVSHYMETALFTNKLFLFKTKEGAGHYPLHHVFFFRHILRARHNSYQHDWIEKVKWHRLLFTREIHNRDHTSLAGLSTSFHGNTRGMKFVQLVVVTHGTNRKWPETSVLVHYMDIFIV